MFKHAWIFQNSSWWTKYWENKTKKKLRKRMAQGIKYSLSSLLWFCIQSSTEDTVWITNPHLIYQHGHDPHLLSHTSWLIYPGLLIASSRIKSSGRSDSWSVYNQIHGLRPEVFSSLHLPNTHGFEQLSHEHIPNISSHIFYFLKRS